MNITRDFGFGSIEGTVTLDGIPITIDSWTDGTIAASVSVGASTGTLLVTRSDSGVTTEVGVTLNIENCTTTTVLNVPSTQFSTIQSAIDAAEAGDLILVAAGTYNENVVMYKPVRLQGAGNGSTFINANPSPTERLQAWHARLDALGATDLVNFLLFDPFTTAETPGFIVLGETVYPNGTDVAPLPGTKTFNPGNSFSAPQAQAVIDGFTISGSKVGGGIFVFGNADDLVISNNEITGNSGSFAGGISIGSEGVDDFQNLNAVIRGNKIHRNSGIQGPGGIAMHEGSDNYLVENNLVTGNLGRFNGGGIGHSGLSLGENIIRDNQILFNEVFFGALLNQAGDGGGISIDGATAGGGGTGNVIIDSNLIQGNMSGAGYGGGIRAFAVNGVDVLNSPFNDGGWYRLKIVNNIIVNNVAALSGAGISLQDVLRAEIINNTIANNDSTATGAFAFEAGAANSTPQPSGVVAGAHSTILLSLIGLSGEPDYANPVLQNNILWHNRSFFNDASLNAGAGGLAANPAGPYWDLGVIDMVGTPPALNPDYSILSSLTGPNGENYDDGFNQEFDPTFILGYSNNLESATVADEGGNAINVRFSPLDQNAGDYHIRSGSPAIEGGTDVTAPELATDYDWEARPNGLAVDIGADEFSAPAFDTTLFVQQLFLDFHGVPGSPTDVQNLVTQIDSGALSRAEAAEAFMLSPEFGGFMAPLVRLYSAFFLRIPDYNGLVFWYDRLRLGDTLWDTAEFFANSAEFQAMYGSLTNEEFVTLVYANVLNRAPEAGGFAFWTGELNDGTRDRGECMVGFSESPEYVGNTVNGVYISMAYTGLLLRAPTQLEYDTWLLALDGGTPGLTLIDDILNSAEYAARL